ncbi:MAG TPA: NosD domain-containing protein [Candidatus Acidoferrales bacterium]|nr:NosD domain-containing protein [Candidatus Acidoferrales bacterium]
MKRNRNVLRAVLIISAGILLCFAGQSAQATTVQVGGCLAGLVNFTTIQAAVTASPTGTIIKICPGNYPEQVTITKNGITLLGVTFGTADNPVITSPTGGVIQNTTSLATGNPIGAQILVGGTSAPALTGVNITGIAVDGSNNQLSGCGAPTLIGIFYQNASGTITQVATRHQTLDVGDAGCQNGLGIFVQSGNALTSTVTVQGSSVHSYQKNGITGNEAGTTITVAGNDIVGQGSTTGAAENGIQIGFGATGKISSNSVADDIWSPDTISDTGDAASGILVYAAAPATLSDVISSNIVASTQFGIAVVTDLTSGPAADAWPITANRVSGTRIFDGIDVCSDGNTVKSNAVFGSDESGIHLDSTCGGATGSSNTVENNTINEACAGIMIGTGASGNTATPNTIHNSGNTILVADSCAAPVFSKTGRRSKPVPIRP